MQKASLYSTFEGKSDTIYLEILNALRREGIEITTASQAENRISGVIPSEGLFKNTIRAKLHGYSQAILLNLAVFGPRGARDDGIEQILEKILGHLEAVLEDSTPSSTE